MTKNTVVDYTLFESIISAREVEKGEVVLAEGEICRSVYFVEQGYLRTYYAREDGDLISLNFTFESDFASNLKSAINREPSKLTIEAGEDSMLWIFDLNKLTPELKAKPEVGMFIRRMHMQMLLAAEARGNLLKIFNATERYRYLEINTPQILQRVPLKHLASFLGISRETVSRIRAKKS